MAFWEVVKNYQVLISSAAALGSTFFIIRNSRLVVAKKNSTDVVQKLAKDDRTLAGLRIIRKYHLDDKKTVSCFAEGNLKEEEKTDRDDVFHALNQYEHLAVGIKNKIYHEKTIRECSYSTVISLYNECKPLIDRARSIESRDSIWYEIEQLAKRWKAKPLKLKS